MRAAAGIPRQTQKLKVRLSILHHASKSFSPADQGCEALVVVVIGRSYLGWSSRHGPLSSGDSPFGSILHA